MSKVLLFLLAFGCACQGWKLNVRRVLLPLAEEGAKFRVFSEGISHRNFILLLNFNSYSEVPNRRADRNKRGGLEKSAPLLAYLLSKLINEQC